MPRYVSGLIILMFIGNAVADNTAISETDFEQASKSFFRTLYDEVGDEIIKRLVSSGVSPLDAEASATACVDEVAACWTTELSDRAPEFTATLVEDFGADFTEEEFGRALQSIRQDDPEVYDDLRRRFHECAEVAAARIGISLE